jgi:hypothetical protein
LESFIKQFEWLMLKNKFVSIIHQLWNGFFQGSLIFTLAQMKSACSKILLMLTLMRSPHRFKWRWMNYSLKDAFSKRNLLQFYARLPILNFTTIKTFAEKEW